jgi:hypothetical protein
MHVHVHHLGGQVEPQERDRLPAREQQAPIGLLHRVQDGPVAERTTGDEQVLQTRAGHVVLGTADEARDRQFPVVGLHLQQPTGHRGPVQTADPIPPRRGGRQVVDPAAIVHQREGHAGVRQRRSHEGFGCMGPLGLRRPEKRPPRRHVAEHLVHLDRGADRTAMGRRGPDTAAVDLERRARPAGRARPDHEPGHLADAGQGLAAEPERPDPLQILGRAELARGMRRHRQRQILGLDAAAVVHDPHQRDPALLERHVDAAGPGVERVLQQLLDHARRPLHDLAGRDAVDHRWREFLDASHAIPTPPRASEPVHAGPDAVT